MTQENTAPYRTNLEQITVQYFCNNIDAVLERVEKEDTRFMILDGDGKECCMLCPVDQPREHYHD